MKYALINLPFKTNVIRRWRCSITNIQYLFPPLEICYLSSILQKQGEETLVIDAIAEKLNFEQTCSKLKCFFPDYIIFMSGLETIAEDIEVAKHLKIELKCKLICFGYLPSYFPEQIISKGDIDIVIIGEPEEAIIDLNNIFKTNNDLSNIQGIAFKKATEIIITKKRNAVSNLDDIPFPDRTQLKQDQYYLPFCYKKPFTTLYTSRSCPFKCSYCVRSWGDEFRQRSVENVLCEIDECVHLYKIKTFWFNDDTFTVNKKWVLDFCEKLKNKQYKIEWTCLSCIDILDEEKIIAMKNAGCNRIMFGVETASERLLKKYNRNQNLKNIVSLTKFIKSKKIEVLGFFLIGGPYEEISDVNESIALAKQLNLDYITINQMRAYYGTDFYNELAANNKVKFNLFPYKVEIENKISQKELSRLIFKFYRSFYLRPSYLLKNFIKILINLPSFVFMAKKYLCWELDKKNIYFD
ncbi:MAG: radical SAM protein [Oligoflexia bacterium]|nr:radical SAM protein [Oligoflexia bacterium]